MVDRPVIVITGASSGIGEAAARLFAHEGYRTVLAARRMERLEALSQEIRSDGGEAMPVETDVGLVDEVHKLVEITLHEYGKIDILFNNAGFGRLDWLERLDPEDDIEAQLRTNLLGLILAARAVVPHMIERRSGHIINMLSMSALIAPPTYSIYAASKFGGRGFTEALRREVSIYNVRVSAIYPGGVTTEFASHAGIQRQTGITTPKLMLLSAEDAADGVMSLVRRPRRSLVMPWPMHLGVWFNALFPGLIDRLIEARFTRKERNR